MSFILRKQFCLKLTRNTHHLFTLLFTYVEESTKSNLFKFFDYLNERVIEYRMDLGIKKGLGSTLIFRLKKR